MTTSPTGPAHVLTDHALLCELAPRAERYLHRHLASAEEWFPHQYVPWSSGRNFDGPLGGQPWAVEQAPLPAPVQDALLVNLLTEDNLPSYHLELGLTLPQNGAWKEWLHHWTAEEARHSDVLRAYLHTTRSVDPVALERLRMQHLRTGHESGYSTLTHRLIYLTVQELATRISHRNTGALCQDPIAERLMARIAADENLHMLFYRDLTTDLFDLKPDAATIALADVLEGFQMPGQNIPGFQQRAMRIAAHGIYDPHIHRNQVVLPLLRKWSVHERTDLTAPGEQARDRIDTLLATLLDQSDRLDRIRSRLQRERATTTSS
ncbi:acyl-ACP desaturase [Streptomyces sp. NPDC059761]|uniref:acyl-ACP desaturase n=1 Tax=Streptomyces sp. NPDC059761 TaxID=3346937 RepID=UPI00366011E3